MFSVRIQTAVFTSKIQEYQKLTQKAMGDVVLEQSRLLADRLTKLTFPATASVGKRRVDIDIARVYLRNSWFEEKFHFRNQKLGERVKQAVERKDKEDLTSIFARSPRLRQIQVEPFDKGK